jgi:hypothetical protein
VRLALSKVPNILDVSLPSLEGSKRYNFRIVVFSSYLEFRAMNKVQTPSNSVFYQIAFSDFLIKIVHVIYRTNMYQERPLLIFSFKFLKLSSIL